jgi:hypothetical protein
VRLQSCDVDHRDECHHTVGLQLLLASPSAREQHALLTHLATTCPLWSTWVYLDDPVFVHPFCCPRTCNATSDRVQPVVATCNAIEQHVEQQPQSRSLACNHKPIGDQYRGCGANGGALSVERSFSCIARMPHAVQRAPSRATQVCQLSSIVVVTELFVISASMTSF